MIIYNKQTQTNLYFLFLYKITTRTICKHTTEIQAKSNIGGVQLSHLHNPQKQNLTGCA